ncbi:uncharacterized protein LOC114862727 [Betta splendens]|uniref:Uncharacterized protein LOC114862727 n=1 Tax=Betta splendens TaxID=158456 RepID=A0A6P7NNP3_BETSP|nr:uncharacterized protein LOC114862727 [Betta splendens]XP_040928327.1 uncharacterized protein LOC114862727 [Betta splendens]
MEVLPLLLVFFIVSGYSYKLQPRLSFMQKAELDTDQLSEMESASSAMERQDEGKSDLVPLESNPEERGDLTPEIKLPGKRKTGIHRNVEGPMERKEERENVSEEGLTGIERVVTEVVTGRGHNKNTVLTHTWIRDDAKHDTAMKVRGKDKQTVREEETGELVAGISLHKETGGDTHEIEKVPTREIIKERGKSNEGQRRAESEASRDEGPVLGSSPPPPTAAPQLLPSAAASVDPLTVAPQREHSVSAGDVILNPLINAARAEPQTTRAAQDPDADVQPEQSRSTPKAEPDPTPKPNDYTLSAKAAELKATTSTTQSKGPGNNVNKSQEKRRNEIKTQKPLEKKKKKVAVETSFHYFTDNYCPLECACYGRVVQCSDKGVERVPYGIPYSARYVLLMNNHIHSIQLDLLTDYVSMEFLVLSNNQLTDGAIEGAFYGVPALKRLYLDQNLLESVPTDLPACLEEIRLDHNRLRAMSPAAWTRSPGLRVLSLSNNSLGDGPEPLPDRVCAR